MTELPHDTTQTGREASHSVDFLRDLLDAAEQAVIATDLEGRVIFWNRYAETLYGWAEDEVLGRDIVDVTPSSAGEKDAREIMSRLQQGERWTGEFVMQHRDGSTFPARVTDSPIHDRNGRVVGIVGVSIDISNEVRDREERRILNEELRAASRAAEEEKLKLYNLFMGAPAFICALRGPDHEFEMANAKCRLLFGESALVGHSVRDVLPEGHDLIAMLDRVYTTGEPFSATEVSVRLGPDAERESEDRFVNFLLQPIIEEDRAAGIFIHGFDVTEQITARQRAESLLDEVQELNRTLERRVADRTELLEAANRRLIHRNRELKDFAYVASHDLKEPLRKIQTFAGLVADECGETLGVTGLAYINRMRRAASRMSQLIEGLLNFSRIGSSPQSLQSVDLTEVVKEVVADLEDQLQSRNGTVEIGALPTVVAEPEQIRRLFRQLIANALKFHRSDAVPHVKVQSAEASEGAEEWAVVTVSDNGIGFDEKYADRIFMPFERLNPRRTYKGIGMGLAICRRIVEHHGGTITATGKPDTGAVFEVRLPASTKPGIANRLDTLLASGSEGFGSDTSSPQGIA